MPYVLYGIILIALIILVRNIRIVPQAQAYVITRLGAYKTTWGVGLHLKIPFIESVAKRLSLKEQVADFPPQPVITKDNVTMQIDTVVYYQITDPKLYTYGIERPIVAIENLSATTLRNIIGDLELDQCLTSRDIVNTKMRQILDEATDPWGIKVNRVELKNILPPKEIQSAMEKQMKAERERREAILRAEGEKRPPSSRPRAKKKESAILRADAKKAGADSRGEGTCRSHPDRAARDRRGHPAHQRVHAVRRRHQAQESRGLRRRRRRPCDEDHYPVRDPGRCRAGGRPGRERQGRRSERLITGRIYTDPPGPARVFGKKERTHMKFPFLKKKQARPGPGAGDPGRAARAPFPFAAPAQDEPVPAIHIDAHVLAVIDAGGTNFRVATVHYEFGQPVLEDERTLPMPGSGRTPTGWTSSGWRPTRSSRCSIGSHRSASASATRRRTRRSWTRRCSA